MWRKTTISLPKPYRSYRAGWVFRNEKPGPGRYRQFMQFDADTVGAASVAADAEICMMAADAMEAVGIKRGDYVVKVNNRKVLDGLMESIWPWRSTSMQAGASSFCARSISWIALVLKAFLSCLRRTSRRQRRLYQGRGSPIPLSDLNIWFVSPATLKFSGGYLADITSREVTLRM